MRKANIWWGPPRNFAPSIEERKISWLELFFDLVYVIAISRITHIFSAHPGMHALSDYAYLFTMVFWGWLNGSMYHDLHGSPGIRTRLMTLWQMMTLAALVVCIDGQGGFYSSNATVTLMIMQVFITYLWWSVGIYDPSHRKYNKPYTICFLFTTFLLFCSMYVESPLKEAILWVALILNYLPPFLAVRILKRHNEDFSLSANMVERLGLFTIIVFGENVLGVINGIHSFQLSDMNIWVNFALGILIVFALWWIFFTLIVDRTSCEGFLYANLIELTYVPTLASLGIIGGSFVQLFQDHDGLIRIYFGSALGIFLSGIAVLSLLLHYPVEFESARKVMRQFLVLAATVILFLSFFTEMSITLYLTSIFVVLLTIIIKLTRIWFVAQLKMVEDTSTIQEVRSTRTSR